MNRKVLHWGLAAAGVVALAVTFSVINSNTHVDAQTPPLVTSSGSLSPAPTLAGASPSSSVPQPRIAVIDRNVILRLSAAGKDIVAQAQALSRSAEAEFKGQAEALQKDGQAYQQQSAILSASVRAEKERDLTQRQQTLQKRVQERDQEIQAGFAKAGRQIDVALGPILQQLMKERGANLLFDKSSVLMSTVDVDISPQAIERLDKALPSVKVELTKPTVAEAAQAAQAAQARRTP